MTIREAGEGLRARRFSCSELVERALRAAEKHSGLNAFLAMTAGPARQQAHELDRELAEGKDRGPLHGIPIALKDLFYTRGVHTTAGSKIFAGFVPEYDATVVERLDAAGAISIGKLNMHELAYGTTSNNPHFGPVRNPHRLDAIPGGSSGGSGAAVAAGIVFCGMGSDTGGSIRIPASYCGVVGIKPTFGRVSRYGCMPLGLTLDHMGPLTRSVADAALVLNAIAGHDPNDESTAIRPAEDFSPSHEPSLSGIRCGVPENFFNERLDPEVEHGYQDALQIAESFGAELVHLRVPDVHALNAIARTVLLCEASAVLQPYWDSRGEIGPDVLALLDQGRLIPATDYVNAQRVRRSMQREWSELFDQVDLLITPTTPIPAPAIGQTTVELGSEDEDVRLASTRLLRGINALGVPAISIPCGTTARGLPIGLQIVGRAWGEKQIVEAAAALEQQLSAPELDLEAIA